jgi:hypothetical protein
LKKVAAILELAVSVFAGLPARDAVVAFAGAQRCDLARARHFEPMMIDDTFGDAFAADQNAVVAQDHEGTAIEIAQQFRRHVGVELEAFEFVILQLAIKSKRMLVDRQQAGLVRRHAHPVDRMGVQCRIQVGAQFQQTGVDDQGTALYGPDVRIVTTLPSKSTFNRDDAVTSPNIQSVRLISMWSGSPGTRKPK